jgi:hypothetical protein
MINVLGIKELVLISYLCCVIYQRRLTESSLEIKGKDGMKKEYACRLELRKAKPDHYSQVNRGDVRKAENVRGIH